MYQILVSLLAVIIPLCFGNQAIAKSNEFYHNKLNSCKVTKQSFNDYEPVEFATSNNLLRKPGQEPMFCGERIVVHGRVLDKNCVPIPDAKIELWQVDCNGKYPYEPLKNAIDHSLVQANDAMTFVGNGTATTNNNGEFYFVTVYPRSVHDISPHLNVRVSHHKIGDLQTILVLNGKRVINPAQDPEMALIAPLVKQMESKLYHFDIVLPGKGMNSY